ncbi:shikimate dehydrogenase [Microbacterium sp. XT11]|uniref:shikimate dehydrogenase n=1 Tax=Microbacterium sp. XT11 TaxID=367477 RepID=UPI000742EF74|nr:shikimate dehydrogenase [Microbacterium sp. XT11]ALX66985.1 hypothetical protein AB663_002549 [Microbacterium sp. XT11]
MQQVTAHRLAVWGDPISHSRSPQLHAAAYRMLGLDWEYGRRRVSAEDFTADLAGLDRTWRGLSLTMPLKEAAYRAADSRDRHAQLTGAVNTLLLGASLHGFNTDVGGIVDALAEQGIRELGRVRIIGAGATAASALVAASDLGAQVVEVRARRPERATGLVDLGERLGAFVTVRLMDEPAEGVDLTVATLPSGTVLPDEQAARLSEDGGVLFDAAYAPWPSALAQRWGSAPAISGFGMLLHQAVRQIRIFLHGDPDTPLPDEPRVVVAMRDAIA